MNQIFEMKKEHGILCFKSKEDLDTFVARRNLDVFKHITEFYNCTRTVWIVFFDGTEFNFKEEPVFTKKGE